MTEAKPKDYWISPTALRITLNALSDADYIQATAASGAMVLCYMKGIEGLEYDNGHNYKRWPLKISQTYFTTTSKKYVYIRIPRAGNSETDTAMVVFPSEHIDLYGATEDGRQIGNAGYYYIWTQGIISASEPSNEGLRRHWEQNMVTGTLDSDEALDSGGTGEWWEYNPTTDMVTFLKKIAHGEFEELLADYLEADQTVTDLLVSRNYLSGPDGAGFRLIRNAGNDVSELETDRITAREKMYGNWLQSSDYTGEGMLDTGFRLWYENGRSKLVIDDIVARGKFSVYELESRIMTHAGGDVCFSSAGSKLFYVEYLDASGEPIGYTTINSPWMLRDKFLLAGVSGLAAWANRRKIQRQLTPEQKTKVTKFRCYVFSDDGTMKTRNWWRVHDLARCQTFDHTQMKQTAEGYYSGDNVSNTVYWRRVAGIGSKRIEALGDNKIYDYFDLWNVLDVSGEKYVDAEGVEHVIGYDIPAEQYTTPGYDASWNDWPAAGDDVVQFGNARDVDRQAVNVLQVTGGEPGLKVYHGIHNYRTDNMKWVDIGYDAGLQRAKADVFGDFYFGARGEVDPRDGSTYVRYNAASKLLEIKARISVQSTYGDSDKSLYDYVRDNIWTPSEIEGMIGEGVEVVQNQLDGNFTIWYGEVAPTLSNYPASQWNTAAKKKEHLYDMYYDKANGYGYRFVSETSGGTQVYKWERVGDSSILASLAAAAAAQDTADGKRRVFVAQPTNADEYDVGDLWVNATYGPTYSNDLLRCKTHKDAGTAFSINHWEKASKYTDDSKFDNFFNTTYKDFVDNIQTQVDGKAETWYQDSDPSTAWTTASVRAKHVGDIWMDLRENQGHKTYIYVDKGEGQNPRYKWEAQEVPSDVFDMIDGKAAIYVNAVSSPPTNYQANDLWILPADATINDVSYKKGEVLTATNDSETYVASHWVKKVCYTDDSAFNSYINQVLNGTGASGDTATVADAARVLNGALKAKTEMDGGLMLTSTLVMRKKESGGSYTTWGGLNGVYSSGTTIAAWFGGGMIDHEASPSAAGYATSLFRMNGSGYVAKGNITWDDDGKVTIQGNTLKTANFYLNGNDVTSILGDLLGMFELDTTTQPGTTLIKAKYSLYSVGDVSALGAGSSGGGGGGGGASTLDELNDVTIASLIDGQALVYDISSRHWKNKTIAQALASLTDVNLSGLQNGQVLIYNSSTQKWKPGSPGKVNQVMLGNVAYDPTSGVVSLPAYPTSLPASDVSAWAKAATKPSYTLDEVNDGSTRKLSNYLPKSGGAMTGIITRDAGGSWIKARDNAVIKTVRTSGQGADWHPAVAIKTSSGCWSFGSVGGETLAISYDTDANYNAENNEAASIYFPSAGSTGTLALTSQFNDYLPKSGGTLTGLLKISTGDGITDASGNGMLCYHPSDWSGVSASQWGVGAITCQGVIRSDNNPLKHYRPDGTYEIIDSKGGQSISSSLRVASLDIHNTNEINGVSNGNAHLNYASSGNVSIANGGGNVCIGGTSYSYKLTVSGSIYATGDVTAASDERKKDFVEYAVLTAEEIANAPAVKFRWKDGRDKDVHAGTYAQYWQKVLPEVVTDKDDTLGVNYGATAVVGLVNLAREVVELKKTVKEQRKVIDEQQKMMEEQRKMLLEMKAEIERLKKG